MARKLLALLIFAGLIAFWLRPHPPKTVDVFGTTYRIEERREIAPGIIGYTDCKTHVVMIQRDADERTVLFHELTHAMVCYTDRVGSGVSNLDYNSTDSQSHEGIYTFTDSWREMFKRNPGLAEYIGG